MSKTFRLFISSPFSDFEKEREVLHKKVFPKIEKYCQDNKLIFQPVDLRWGVNEEAQLDQKTLEVCLEEVRACKHFPHPNFLIMAGDRYGYVPCPYMIEEKEFSILQNNIKKDEELTLLNYWYKLDTNQIPSSYILQQRTDKYKDYTTWVKQEIQLRTILQKAAKHINKGNKEYQKYFLSATEQEAIEGICQFKGRTHSQENCNEEIDIKYVIGYIRTIESANDNYIDKAATLEEVEKLKIKAMQFKNSLKDVLDEANILKLDFSTFKSIENYEKNQLAEFEKYISDKLIDAIDEQVKESKDISKLKQEIAEQEKFLQDKVKGFQGRADTLTAIKNYSEKRTTQSLIIHGPSGMGKSSLMAKAIEETKSNNKIFRFVGATANSTTIRNLLISIVDEFQDKNIIEQIDKYEADENKFDTQIKDILESIENDTIIFIDALDQLQHINYLNWLPDKLPTNLSIILSVLNDKKYEKDTHYYNLLNQRYYNAKFLDITKDSLEKNKESLITDLLKTENRQLNTVQKDYLLNKWANADYSPLYLKIAIEAVKHWKDYRDKKDNPLLCTKQKLNDGVEEVILEYIQNLKALYHHEELLVKKVFGYIYASKNGLSEQELLQILSEDLEDDKDFRDVIINKYHKAIKVKNPRRDNTEEHILPKSIWSRLHTLLKPFIIERNIDNQPLMKFFHRQFISVVEEYTKDDKVILHTKLASYFTALQDKEKLWNERYYNLHMLDELPFQLFHSNNSEQLKEVLFDLEFAGSIYNNYKQDDFRKILEKSTELKDINKDEIYHWKSFYKEKDYLITGADNKQWRKHQILFQLSYEDGIDFGPRERAEVLLNQGKVNFSWLKHKNRNNTGIRSGYVKKVAITSNGSLNTDELIITWSDHTFYLWNKKTDKQFTSEEIFSIKDIFIYQSNKFIIFVDSIVMLRESDGSLNLKIKLDKESISDNWKNKDVLTLKNGNIIIWRENYSYPNTKSCFYLFTSNGQRLNKYSWNNELLNIIQTDSGGILAIVQTGSNLDDYSKYNFIIYTSEGIEKEIYTCKLSNNDPYEILNNGNLLFVDGKKLVLFNCQTNKFIVLEKNIYYDNYLSVWRKIKIVKEQYIVSSKEAKLEKVKIWNINGECLFQKEFSYFNRFSISNDLMAVELHKEILLYNIYLPSEVKKVYTPWSFVDIHFFKEKELLILCASKDVLFYDMLAKPKYGDKLGKILEFPDSIHEKDITKISIINKNTIITWNMNEIVLWDLTQAKNHFIYKNMGSSFINYIQLENQFILAWDFNKTKLMVFNEEGKQLFTSECNHEKIKTYIWNDLLVIVDDIQANIINLVGDIFANYQHDERARGIHILDQTIVMLTHRDSSVFFDLTTLSQHKQNLLDQVQYFKTIEINKNLYFARNKDGNICMLDKNFNVISIQNSDFDFKAMLKVYYINNKSFILKDGKKLIFYINECLEQTIIARGFRLNKLNKTTYISYHNNSDTGFSLININGAIKESVDTYPSKIIGLKVLLNDTFVTWHQDNALCVWDNNGKLKYKPIKHMENIRGYKESFNGCIEVYNSKTHRVNYHGILEGSHTKLLVWTDNNIIYVYGEDGKLLHKLKGHADNINGLKEFSENKIISWSDDNTVRIWSLEAGISKVLKGKIFEQQYMTFCGTPSHIQNILYKDNKERIIYLPDVSDELITAIAKTDTSCILESWKGKKIVKYADMYKDGLNFVKQIQERDFVFWGIGGMAILHNEKLILTREMASESEEYMFIGYKNKIIAYKENKISIWLYETNSVTHYFIDNTDCKHIKIRENLLLYNKDDSVDCFELT